MKTITILCFFIGTMIGFYSADFKHKENIEKIEKQREIIGKIRLENWQLKRQVKWLPILEPLISDEMKLELEILQEKKENKQCTLHPKYSQK